MTYRDDIYTLLSRNPDFEAPELCDIVGCSYSIARHYRNSWELSREMDFRLPRVRKTTHCNRCPLVPLCKPLALAGLPILCERVTQMDLDCAKRDGTLVKLLWTRERATQIAAVQS